MVTRHPAPGDAPAAGTVPAGPAGSGPVRIPAQARPPRSHPDAGPPADDGLGRDLSIPAIGTAPWGTHICEFFRSQQDLLDTLVPYVRAGLENNEACIWRACDPLNAEQAAEAMSRELDDFEQRVDRGQLMIMSTDGWYTSSGAFEKDRVLSTVVPRVQAFVDRGYAGMRVTGNMAWLEDRDWDAFMAYEQGLNQVMTGRPILGLCTYSLDKCDAAHLIDVLMRHRYGLVRDEDWTLIEPSERKRATQAVERMNLALAERSTELQAALADLRGFSRWVTHDLRAPLASIASFADLLAADTVGILAEPQQAMLDRIRTAAARMDRLITGTLAYSEAQHLPLHARPVDLRPLVEQAWTEIRGGLPAGAAGLRVQLQIDPLPTGHGDPGLLTRALTALLANAMKYCADRPDALVEVGASTSDTGETVYHVRDNGVGFDPGDADHLFGAFIRLHTVAHPEGTGLGLAVVKEIITRHGGRVWAEAVPGAGATFRFTLPAPAPPELLG